MPGVVLLLAVLSSCTSAPRPVVTRPAAETKPTVYHLRAGDVVQVDVFQEPIMTSRQRVLGDGTIFVGLIGRVNVLNETVETAATKIAAELNEKQLVNPQVTLTILAYAPRRFSVWGQVKAAGTYVIPPEENIFLPEAIAMAGGNTVIGNPKKIIISRRSGDAVQQIRENALSDEGQLFKIEEGDNIFVTETVF